MNSPVIRGLLSAKAEMLTKRIRESNPGKRAAIDATMAWLDEQVDQLREALRLRSLVNVAPIRNVG